MFDAIPNSVGVLTIFFAALLIIPLFIPPAGRRERGFIYGFELAVIFFAWYKIRNADALLIGQVIWQPKEVAQLRTFLLGVIVVTALFLLYQFIPRKSSTEADDLSGSKSASGR